MSHGAAFQYLHWFWIVFFALFGLFSVAISRRTFGAYVPAARLGDPSLSERFNEALCKRRKVEQISTSLKLLPGVTSIALSPIMAFTNVQAGLAYGFLTLVTAGAMTGAYLQLRNRQRIRVAMLTHRSPENVIPAVWFVLAAVQGVIALAGLQIHAAALGAVFVCISSLVCAQLAWRVTQMPALLTGDDLAIEQAIDVRLRLNRAAGVLGLAFIQTFVFIAQIYPLDMSSTLEAAYVAATLLPFVYLSWYSAALFKKVGVPQEVA